MMVFISNGKKTTCFGLLYYDMDHSYGVYINTLGAFVTVIHQLILRCAIWGVPSGVCHLGCAIWGVPSGVCHLRCAILVVRLNYMVR